jgi:predicted phosphohydrolase
MKVFAIGDLHLCAAGDKPMDVFGPQWTNHQDAIQRNWTAVVGADDLVLLCGDLSWAMRLNEARRDLDFIDALPGTKYFIQGNHDYWCSGPAQVRQILGPSTHLVRFDAAVHEGVGICGIRSWIAPSHPDFVPEEDTRHWQRAQIRLDLSLRALGRLSWDVAVAMFHYPPRGRDWTTVLCDSIRDAGVRYCVYGHLHGPDTANCFEGEADGVEYRCVSADHVDFTPSLLFETAT